MDNKIIIASFLPALDPRVCSFMIRIAWGFSMVQYQSLALFIESLVDNSSMLNYRHKFFLFVSFLFFTFFIGLAFIDFNHSQAADNSLLEFRMQKMMVLYSQFLLTIVTLLFAFIKIRSVALPRILKRQLTILIQALIIPHLISDFIQMYPFGFLSAYDPTGYAFVSISNMFLTFAIYYCSRKVMGLRFLNFQEHVQAHHKFSFIDNFKDVLEQLSYATSLQELGHITQTFFKDAFGIPLRRVTLHVRQLSAIQTDTLAPRAATKTESQAEYLFGSGDTQLNNFIFSTKVLIQDEIAFSHFYEKDRSSNSVLSFLEEDQCRHHGPYL